MTRFIFVRVGAVLLIAVVALLVARYFITQSLSCVPACINASLINRDLRNTDLSKTSFVEANLQRSNLTGSNLRWVDFSGANLSNAVLADTDLREAKLIGANLTGADLRGANVKGADMSGAVLDGADLTQVDLTETRLNGISLIGTKLVQANLTQVLLAGVSLTSADLNGANLTGANISGTAMSRANLSGAIMVNSDVAGTWLNLANLTGADLTGADLSGSSLIGANLASARLGGARLTGANLIGALFLGTDLRSASLQGIRLVTSEILPRDFADPELADLNEIDLSAVIVDANLRGVQHNDETQWPSGKLILLAGLLGQEFAEVVAAQEAAVPTPEPTPIPAEEEAVAAPLIGQPEEEGPAITFALSGPGRANTKNLYNLFQAQGYTDTIGFWDVSTSAAIPLLCETSEVDAILMAKVITDGEMEACRAAGHELIGIEIGTAPLVFITDLGNTFFTDLTFSEIPLFFTAERWKEIRPDWPDELIMRFFTDPGLSAFAGLRQEFFGESESDPIATAPNTIFESSEPLLVQAIANTPNSLGLFSMNVFVQNAEILKMATIGGITPNTTTVASGTYTLTQPLMLYSDLARTQEKPEVGYFLWYHLDNDKTLLERAGFISSSPERLEQSHQNLAFIPRSPLFPLSGEGAGGGSAPETGQGSPTSTPTP